MKNMNKKAIITLGVLILLIGVLTPIQAGDANENNEFSDSSLDLEEHTWPYAFISGDCQSISIGSGSPSLINKEVGGIGEYLGVYIFRGANLVAPGQFYKSFRIRTFIGKINLDEKTLKGIGFRVTLIGDW